MPKPTLPKPIRTVLAAGAATLGATVVLAPHAASDPVVDDGPVAAAVTTITTAEAATAARSVPRDFADVIGYRPEIRDGVLVAPHGSCSSPVPLPTEFDTACMAHDLGYDLLRYGDRTGAPVGAWARRALDRQLDERMHAACLTRPDDVTRASCRVIATTAATAVASNSWRQDYAAPRPESPLPYATAGAAVLAVGAVRRRFRGAGTDLAEVRS